jgi:predicted RNase H-like HicB family nuclease
MISFWNNWIRDTTIAVNSPDRCSSHIVSQVQKKGANKFRYEVIIYWSELDQAFVAEVQELSGCVVDGATYQEAVVNTQLVIFNRCKGSRDRREKVCHGNG